MMSLIFTKLSALWVLLIQTTDESLELVWLEEKWVYRSNRHVRGWKDAAPRRPSDLLLQRLFQLKESSSTSDHLSHHQAGRGRHQLVVQPCGKRRKDLETVGFQLWWRNWSEIKRSTWRNMSTLNDPLTFGARSSGFVKNQNLNLPVMEHQRFLCLITWWEHSYPTWWPPSGTCSWSQMSSAAEGRRWSGWRDGWVVYKHLQNTCSRPPATGVWGPPRYLRPTDEYRRSTDTQWFVHVCVSVCVCVP